MSEELADENTLTMRTLDCSNEQDTLVIEPRTEQAGVDLRHALWLPLQNYGTIRFV